MKIKEKKVLALKPQQQTSTTIDERAVAAFIKGIQKLACDVYCSPMEVEVTSSLADIIPELARLNAIGSIVTTTIPTITPIDTSMSDVNQLMDFVNYTLSSIVDNENDKEPVGVTFVRNLINKFKVIDTVKNTKMSMSSIKKELGKSTDEEASSMYTTNITQHGDVAYLKSKLYEYRSNFEQLSKLVKYIGTSWAKRPEFETSFNDKITNEIDNIDFTLKKYSNDAEHLKKHCDTLAVSDVVKSCLYSLEVFQTHTSFNPRVVGNYKPTEEEPTHVELFVKTIGLTESTMDLQFFDFSSVALLREIMDDQHKRIGLDAFCKYIRFCRAIKHTKYLPEINPRMLFEFSAYISDLLFKLYTPNSVTSRMIKTVLDILAVKGNYYNKCTIKYGGILPALSVMFQDVCILFNVCYKSIICHSSLLSIVRQELKHVIDLVKNMVGEVDKKTIAEMHTFLSEKMDFILKSDAIKNNDFSSDIVQRFVECSNQIIAAFKSKEGLLEALDNVYLYFGSNLYDIIKDGRDTKKQQQNKDNNNNNNNNSNSSSDNDNDERDERDEEMDTIEQFLEKDIDVVDGIMDKEEEEENNINGGEKKASSSPSAVEAIFTSVMGIKKNHSKTVKACRRAWKSKRHMSHIHVGAIHHSSNPHYFNCLDSDEETDLRCGGRC